MGKSIKILMESTLEIIIIFDCTGRIKKCNKAAREVLGYGEQTEDENIADILLKEFEAGKTLEKVLEELGKKTTAVFYRANKTCFETYIGMVYDEEAGLYYLFAVDRGKSRELEHEVERIREMASQAMEVKNEFAANVTHELRTPVNGIRGHVENLKDTCLTTDQRRTLDIIENCCDNMSAMINNILDFSKLESGKFELEERKFEFRDMMDKIVSANMAAVNEKGLRFSINIAEDIPVYLIGDELRLTQIMNNLLSNAIKFTSVGFIRVEITQTLWFNDEIELFFMVADSGIGISKEDQDRLFKSFSQVDTSITRRYGGTGLGLAITKELIELMNGKVYLESEKGRGSNFSFTVKLRAAENNAAMEEYRKEVFRFMESTGKHETVEELEEYYRYGSEKNRSEINIRMEKLVLCIELAAWDKAELWAEELKKLVENGDKDIKRAVLKLGMAVRKSHYETSMEFYEKTKLMLEEKSGRL